MRELTVNNVDTYAMFRDLSDKFKFITHRVYPRTRIDREIESRIKNSKAKFRGDIHF